MFILKTERGGSMLIQDKKALKGYTTDKHLWLGIPSIETTKNGRCFVTFYSGGTREEIGNYCLLIKSDDGKHYGEPIAVCFEKGHRCFDPCLWIDPLGRLWFTWSRFPDDGLFGAICDDPDAEEIVFGEEFFIGNNIMMNKPTVLSSGEWLFPIAVWEKGIHPIHSGIGEKCDLPAGAFAYASYDNGKSFKRLGGALIKGHSYDEHAFLEMEDGRIRSFIRTKYGIGAADSFDGGSHWSDGFDTGYKGPCARFHIRRLPSGRIFLINHFDYKWRDNLYAMLSEDDGKTFPYKLLLDDRSEIAYPDAALDSEGMINITYDRERGVYQSSLDAIKKCAREILTARITEEDIINGKLVSEKSFLKNTAYKLSDYTGELKNPFNEKELFTSDEYARYLRRTSNSEEDVISRIFDAYNMNCTNIHSVKAENLDRLIEQYKKEKSLDALNKIILLIRSADSTASFGENLTDNIRKYIVDNLEKACTLEDIAEEFHFSCHYIRHIFKKAVGMSVGEFKTAQKIKKAKLLLKNTDSKITDVAMTCGFESASYFTKTFTKEIGITPSEYRKART